MKILVNNNCFTLQLKPLLCWYNVRHKCTARIV